LVDFATARFKDLCEGAGFGDATGGTVALFGAPPRLRDVRMGGASSEWVSEISDDNTRSSSRSAIATETAEVRALFEPKAKSNAAGVSRAGWPSISASSASNGADLTRFHV